MCTVGLKTMAINADLKSAVTPSLIEAIAHIPLVSNPLLESEMMVLCAMSPKPSKEYDKDVLLHLPMPNIGGWDCAIWVRKVYGPAFGCPYRITAYLRDLDGVMDAIAIEEELCQWDEEMVHYAIESLWRRCCMQVFDMAMAPVSLTPINKP